METILEKWVYFLKCADELEVIPVSADTEPLHAAYEVANQFSWTREELEVYDYWSIKTQDERGAVQLALAEGEQKGLQKGRQEGLKKDG